MMIVACLRRRVGLFIVAVAGVLPALAWASCIPVAELPPRFVPADYRVADVPPGSVHLTFLGHASFLIETSGGATAVTDYN
ncbi:MAG TPA: hypothetical protein VGB82_24185, partial [Alphaproteobacteria bacterium]